MMNCIFQTFNDSDFSSLNSSQLFNILMEELDRVLSLVTISGYTCAKCRSGIASQLLQIFTLFIYYKTELAFKPQQANAQLIIHYDPPQIVSISIMAPQNAVLILWM